MTIKNIYKIIPDETACIKLLEDIIWDSVPKCPYCSSLKAVPIKESNRYHCNGCNTSFSVTVNTIFHKTKIPLQKWFYVIILNETEGLNVSVRDLGEHLNITKDTANRIVNKINNFYFSNKILFTSINKKISDNV